jgi:hypothetical protein
VGLHAHSSYRAAVYRGIPSCSCYRRVDLRQCPYLCYFCVGHRRPDQPSRQWPSLASPAVWRGRQAAARARRQQAISTAPTTRQELRTVTGVNGQCLGNCAKLPTLPADYSRRHDSRPTVMTALLLSSSGPHASVPARYTANSGTTGWPRSAADRLNGTRIPRCGQVIGERSLRPSASPTSVGIPERLKAKG